ncbi:MAG: biopolymer transporter ExbD [Alphaproteobacteria bacterium]|nr:biopolymer transporter ExbD [Alphaproteobacteria bacterium]MBL6940173.1 biopolymer transporter ExbD [Alphaproteobacteria bacterium]MBL7100260.1 biopolymer transporter ExbD [Alphaproteobacteria bacterium]
MAMNVGNESGEGEVMVEMNTTPLIDVMLVLLTLLIITLPIQTHAVKLDMPRPNQKPPPTPPVVVTLEVDFDGTVLWNGTPVDRPTLDSYLQSASTDDPQPEIHLQPNRLAKYDRVAMVLADAQRIGVTHIGFTGIENMQ